MVVCSCSGIGGNSWQTAPSTIEQTLKINWSTVISCAQQAKPKSEPETATAYSSDWFQLSRRACACLDPLAVRFCGVGALYRAAGELLSGNVFNRAREAEHLVLAASNELHGLQTINDIEGRDAVIALFKVALGQ